MEQIFPSTWVTPKSIAYQPVSTNSANEEKTPGYSPNTVPDQTSSSPPSVYPDGRSISISNPSCSSPSTPPSPQKNRKYRGIFSDGWRAGVTYSAITAVVVLFVNTILTIWASQKYRPEGGIGKVFEGYCKDTKRASLWLHLVINTLSTVLLSASNYTMQCLSAPTRAEVDKAHARNKWLDIGVPSLRNLGKISKGKLVLWLLLGFSSVPLHLIYNSAVFSELSTYQYISRLVTESESQELYWTNKTDKFLGDEIQKIQLLDKKECMAAYAKQLIPDRKNLAVVVSGNISDIYTETLYHSMRDNGYNTGLQPYAWICNSTGFSNSCSVSEALTKVDTWAIHGAPVQYCLSQKMPEQCRLQYSLHIMIAVIMCNAVKAVCMFLAVINSKEEPLVTVGDAVASFLNSEDTTTVGMCIVTKKEIKKGWRPAKAVPGEWPPHMWKPYRAFWFSAASVSRWVLCNFLAITGISTSLGLLIRGLKTWRDAKVQYNLRFFWNMGLGAPDIRAVVYFGESNNSYRDLISSILLANLPQTIFSFLYLLYNSIFTCMLLVEEWDRFSHQRRPLRVTSPTGTQRSTYFLHLPYRYSIPLMIGSGTMHWLISQSIFLVRVAEVSYSSSQETSYSIVGYSPISIIFGFILGTLMLVVAFISGFRRYGSGIPLVGSCSAAISAACHPGLQKTPAAIVPVMWGVVSVDSDGDIGHCSFSGEEVSPPVLGQWYSGGSSGSEHMSINGGIMRYRHGEP